MSCIRLFMYNVTCTHFSKIKNYLSIYVLLPREQLQAGSQEFANWLHGGFHEIIDNKRIPTFGGR